VEKYNGWVNYETWVVKLWLDNDQGLYEMVREWSIDITDTHELGDRIEEELKGFTPATGVYADLLNASMSKVDWYEIAEAIHAET
jgi:hypothetical protein